jgi:TatD DNase family protein
VTIGTGVEDARRAREVAERYPGYVAVSAGIDPFTSHAAGDGFDDALAALDEMLREGGIAALGEIGLDYHYDLDPRTVQAERLERQLDLAAALDRPVVIHVRDAHDDMAAILRAHTRNRGVIHSFTGGPEEAAAYLELGWMLGFGGVITFKNAGAVREAARTAPSDKILVETDAPYLAPVPHRGMRCEPSFLTHTVATLASVRGESEDRVAAATTRNAHGLFGFRG